MAFGCKIASLHLSLHQRCHYCASLSCDKSLPELSMMRLNTHTNQQALQQQDLMTPSESRIWKQWLLESDQQIFFGCCCFLKAKVDM